MRETASALAVLATASYLGVMAQLSSSQPQQQVASYCSRSRTMFCLEVQTTSDGSAVVTVQSASTGWAAVGFGTSGMSANAPAYVGWNNGNSVVVSARTLVSADLPPVAAIPAQVVPVTSAIIQDAKIAFAFTVPASLFTSGATQCVFALSSTPPSDPSSASSTFKRHSEEGSFSLTLRSATGIALSTTSNSPSASPSTIRTQAQSTYCYDASLTFCVVAVRDEVVRRVSFTMYSSYSGWMGIGTGSQMQGSIMFVAWKNSRGQMVLSQRAGSGHGTPYPIASTFIQEISPPSSVTLPVTASMSVTFSLASNNTILSLSSALPFIFATSNISPSFPDDPTSNFPQHTLKGTMSLDLSQLGSVSAGASTNDDAGSLQLWHGILMFFAWGVLPFALIFIARYLKTRLGHSWFRIHAGGFMLGVGGLTALSLLLIELQVSPGAQRFLDAGPHGVLGLVLCFVLLPTQVLLGVLCNILYRTLRRDVPWWDQVHWWCGRGVVVAALVQLQLGLNTYGAPAWATVLLWVWVAVVLALFLGVREMLWGGVVHHVAKAGSAYPFPAVRRGPVGLRYAGSTEMVPVLGDAGRSRGNGHVMGPRAPVWMSSAEDR